MAIYAPYFVEVILKNYFFVFFEYYFCWGF